MNILSRSLMRWLAPLVVAGACFLPTANGQLPVTTMPKEEVVKNPAPQYLVAVFSLLGIMLILCKPSRKT
jgi:hypothetical protein